jgi:adenylate cyclase
VTLVKTIGDAVMLASRDAEVLTRAVLELLARRGAPSSELPPLRAGGALGETVRRGGDYFGHTVNVASRLTSVAEPHEFAVNEAIARSAPDSADWRDGGTPDLRGVKERVEVFVASAR